MINTSLSERRRLSISECDSVSRLLTFHLQACEIIHNFCVSSYLPAMSHGSPSSLTVFPHCYDHSECIFIYFPHWSTILSFLPFRVCPPSSCFSTPSSILLYPLFFPSWSLQTDSQVGAGLVSALHFLSAVSVSRLSGPAGPRTVLKKKQGGGKKRVETQTPTHSLGSQQQQQQQQRCGAVFTCEDKQDRCQVAWRSKRRAPPTSGRVGIMLESLTCSHSSRTSLKVCTRNAFINVQGRCERCTDDSFGFTASRWQKSPDVVSERLTDWCVICTYVSDAFCRPQLYILHELLYSVRSVWLNYGANDSENVVSLSPNSRRCCLFLENSVGDSLTTRQELKWLSTEFHESEFSKHVLKLDTLHLY